MTRTWDELLDEARAGARVDERVRERWLGQQALESATLVGALVDLAEHELGISVRLQGSRRHDGAITALGHDVVVLSERGERVVVPVSAITAVRPLPGGAAGAATGDRPAAVDVSFAGVLALLAGDRPEVAVSLRDGEVLAGLLVAVGVDVASLQVGDGLDGVVYVSLPAMSSVRFRSG